jgi:hypothetical protein
MALTARVQRHVAGDWDDSEGTIHSYNAEATAPAIVRGAVLSANGGTQLRICVAADKGPIYICKTAKPLNQTYVDALYGEHVIFYVIADGIIPARGLCETGATGKIKASAGTNPVVAQYVKHGTKSNDPVTPLASCADGDVIGIKIIRDGSVS